jgi:Flp pilus assembly protein TadG
MQRKTRNWKEKGQATMLVLVALSLFLLAGMGLTLDVSQLYSHRQMAQNAADASALAAMRSIYNSTNTTNATFNNTFGNIVTAGQNPARLTCASNDNHTPCYYARQNGFDPANGDTVYVDFWAQANAFSQEPGVTLSNSVKDPVPLLRLTVIRPVPATLMQLVGGGTKNVAAQATAAIVTSVAPIPILVLHPTKSGALTTSGTGNVDKIKICGGPKRSIQVNSCAGTGGSIAKPNGTGSVTCATGSAFTWNGNPVIDLSRAGPLDNKGDCSNGTGGDFGNFGLPLTVSGTSPLNMGTAGVYLDPTSVIADPLINIPAPTTTGLTNQDATTACTEAKGLSTCPDALGKAVTCPITDPSGAANPQPTCTVLWPGIYNNSLQSIKGSKLGYVIFTPGIYYIQSGGISFDAGSTGQTVNFPTTQGVYPTCTNANAQTGCGVLFYLAQNGGTFNVSANASNLFLLGADPLGTYQKIVIFVDHGAPAQSHTLGGSGKWNVTGTIYATNTVPTILNSASQAQFQSFGFQGVPASGTVNGEIIVDQLNLGGTPNITMNLDPATLQIRQIALVR